MDIITSLWNDAFNYIFGTEFLIMALVVIGAMEVIKKTFQIPEKWSSTIMPYIALVLSMGVVGLSHITEFHNIEAWILHGLLQAFFVDIFYTYLGKFVIQVVPGIWNVVFHWIMSKKSNANKE